MNIKKLACACLCLALMSAGALAKENAVETTDFQGVTIAGEEINLSDYRGKVVIVDFWASWCGPCKKEFPFLVQLYKKVNKGERQYLEILAINLDGQPEMMKKFLTDLDDEVPFPILTDPEGKLPKKYKVEAMPTTLFIDREGKIRFRHQGFEKDHMQTYISELMALLKEDVQK